jgi:hypothetical protein
VLVAFLCKTTKTDKRKIRWLTGPVGPVLADMQANAGYQPSTIGSKQSITSKYKINKTNKK